MNKFYRIFKKVFFCFALLAVSAPAFLGFVNSVDSQELPDPPVIISRAEWGADETLKTWEAEYKIDAQGYSINKADYIVVHHTASSNLRPDEDGSGKYTAMVNAIYRYHTTNATWDDASNGASVRGFGDIGYNYLIDPNGHIYQGRIGANGTIAAHVYGHNTGTIGIALIGTYGATLNGQYVAHTITPAMEESLKKLTGWLAAANGLNLNQQILVDNKYLFPLNGHKDLRPTACPGENLYAKLPAIRQAAAVYAQSYAQYLYQSPDSAKVFLLRDGLRRDYDNFQEFQKTGVAYSKLVQASLITKTLFTERAFLKYPDGTLLQEIGLPAIYYLQNGQKRPLNVSAAEFEKLSFSWSGVVQIDPLDLKMYETGTEIKFAPEGKLVQDAAGKVFFTEKGKKRWVPSQILFAHLGYAWKNVKADPLAVNYLEGDVMRYKSGTLVKGDGPAVYAVEGASRRLITSQQLFTHLGLDWKNLKEIGSDELAFYSEGEAMLYKNGTLVKEKNDGRVYLLEEGKKRPFTSAEIFLARGYAWKNILELSADEIVRYHTGAFMGYPDGVLLKADGGTRIFAVKNGAPNWIQSAQEFQKAGYKWEAVKTIPVAEFSLLYPGVVFSDAPAAPITNEPAAPVTNEPVVNEPQRESNQLDASLGGLIRIGLKQLALDQEVQITADGPFSQYNASGQKVASYASGETAKVAAASGVDVKFSGDSSNTIMQALSYTDSPAWKPSLNYNRFRGALLVKYSAHSGAPWLINELPFEHYIQGIGEALNDDHPEYQKAFSIMTRSYSYFHLQNGGKRPGEIFHLNNTSSDQVYKGYVFETIAANLVNAVQQTRGTVMKYNNKIARSVYSSDSGGTTVSGCAKWGGEFCGADYGYLAGGVKDPEGTVHNDAKIKASHGVGVSCIGARRLAALGSGFEDILKYYYSGISLEKVY